MIDLVEVFERAEIGPLTSETDYYMKRFVPKLTRMIARHGIKWDKNTIINTDDDLTDRIFQAAVDLLAEAGAYCPETNRVMEFTTATRSCWPAASARPRRPSAKAASATSCAAVAPTPPTIARRCRRRRGLSTRPTNRSSWTRSRRWPRSTSSTRSACPRSSTFVARICACARRKRSSRPARPCVSRARASAARAAPACRSSTASRPLRSRPRCSRPATPTSACGRATGS